MNKLHRQAVAYYALCNRAAALGIPTSLDDPHTAKTIAGLRAQVVAVERGLRLHNATVEREQQAIIDGMLAQVEEHLRVAAMREP